MRKTRRLWLGVLLLALDLPVSGRAQEVPTPTPEGEKTLNELIRGCLADGGLKRAGKGPAASWQIDEVKLRATVAGHRDLLTPALRDALIGGWFRVAGRDEEVLAALLEAFGREKKDERALGFAAFFAGSRSNQQGQLGAAARAYERAAQHLAATPETTWQALVLNNLGSVLRTRGEYARAQRVFEQTLALCRQLYPEDRYPQGHPWLATCLNNLGSVAQAQGEHAQALRYHEQALAMRRWLYPPERYPHGHTELATSLNNLAVVLTSQGEYGKAQDYYEQALAMRRRLYPAGHPELAQSVNSLGVVLEHQEKYHEALVYHRQALAMYRKLYPPDRYPRGHSDLATVLHDLGSVLASQGEYARALDYQQQALAMYRALYPQDRYPRGHPWLAQSLGDLGQVFEALGEYGKAQRCYEETLAMCRKLYPEDRYPRGHPYLAACLNNLASLFRRQGEYARAVKTYDDALHALRVADEPVSPDRGPEAAALLRPMPHTVTVLANRALALERALAPQPTTADLRRCEQAYALAVAVGERVRAEVLQQEQSKLQHGAEGSWVVPRRVGLCSRLFDREHDAGHLRTAFAVVEQGRARVFLESLGQANASRLAGLPPALRAEEDRLRRQLRLCDARARSVQDRPGAEAAALLDKVWLERRDTEEQLRRFERKLAETHPQYAALRYPKPCSVEDARRCLDPGEAALVFAVGADVSHVVIVQARPDPKDRTEGLAIVRLPGERVLREKVEALTQRERLEAPDGTRSLGAELYNLLLGPLAGYIRGKDLVLVPDGPLCQLPFELLVEGGGEDREGRYLIEGHRIRYAPSLTALHLIRLWERGRQVQPDRPLFALGDPVFDSKDDRLHQQEVTVAQATQQERGELLLRAGRAGRLLFQRLLATGAEVRGIADLLHAQPEAVLTGPQASEAAVKRASGEGALARYRYVHFATHGILGLDRGQPPALVLSQVGTTGQEDEYGRDDGFLTLPEVSALKLNADLVVLSACRTGEGRMHNGEGVSGLARVFLYAGSRGVVCSLWSVDDAATSELMQGMYRRLQKGDSTAEALRQAKLDLIKDDRPPLLWAPFIHLGR